MRLGRLNTSARARAALVVNFFNHAVLTLLLYILAWAWRAG